MISHSEITKAFVQACPPDRIVEIVSAEPGKFKDWLLDLFEDRNEETECESISPAAIAVLSGMEEAIRLTNNLPEWINRDSERANRTFIRDAANAAYNFMEETGKNRIAEQALLYGLKNIEDMEWSVISHGEVQFCDYLALAKRFLSHVDKRLRENIGIV